MNAEVDKTIRFWRFQFSNHRWERFVKHAVETASDDMMRIQNFINIGSGFQTFLGRIHIYKDIQARTDKDVIS
jgi:hypothetical protein